MTEIVPSYERAAGLAQSMIATKRAGRFPFDNPKLFPDEKVPEGIERGSFVKSGRRSKRSPFFVGKAR